MALTDEQKTEAIKAFDATWVYTGETRVKDGSYHTAMHAYLAATERMQEENAKLRERIEVMDAQLSRRGYDGPIQRT